MPGVWRTVVFSLAFCGPMLVCALAPGPTTESGSSLLSRRKVIDRAAAAAAIGLASSAAGVPLAARAAPTLDAIPRGQIPTFDVGPKGPNGAAVRPQPQAFPAEIDSADTERSGDKRDSKRKRLIKENPPIEAGLASALNAGGSLAWAINL